MPIPRKLLTGYRFHGTMGLNFGFKNSRRKEGCGEPIQPEPDLALLLPRRKGCLLDSVENQRLTLSLYAITIFLDKYSVSGYSSHHESQRKTEMRFPGLF